MGIEKIKISVANEDGLPMTDVDKNMHIIATTLNEVIDFINEIQREASEAGEEQ